MSEPAEPSFSFPVSVVQQRLQDGKFASRVAPGAPVFLSAVLSEVATEIIKQAGREVHKEDDRPTGRKRPRIAPRHIHRGLNSSKDLQQLARGMRKPELDYAKLRGMVLMVDGNRGSGKTQLLKALHQVIKGHAPCHFELNHYNSCFDAAVAHSPLQFALTAQVHRTTACFTLLGQLQRLASSSERMICAADCSPLSRLASAMQCYSQRLMNDKQIAVYMDFYDGCCRPGPEMILYTDVDAAACATRLSTATAASIPVNLAPNAIGMAPRAAAATSLAAASSAHTSASSALAAREATPTLTNASAAPSIASSAAIFAGAGASATSATMKGTASTRDDTAAAAAAPAQYGTSIALLDDLDGYLFDLVIRQCALKGNIVVVPWHHLSHIDELVALLIRVRSQQSFARVLFMSGINPIQERRNQKNFVYCTESDVQSAYQRLQRKEVPFSAEEDEDCEDYEEEEEADNGREASAIGTAQRLVGESSQGQGVDEATPPRPKRRSVTHAAYFSAELWFTKSNATKRVVMAHLSRLHDVVFFAETNGNDMFGCASWLS